MSNRKKAPTAVKDINYHWFGLQHDMLEDKLYLVIAKKCKVEPSVVFTLWMLLYRHANANDPRGSIKGYDADEIGIFFGIDAEIVERIIAEMMQRFMIDKYHRVASFFITQDLKSAQSSTERSRKSRISKKVKQNQRALQRKNVAKTLQCNEMQRECNENFDIEERDKKKKTYKKEREGLRLPLKKDQRR